MRVVEKENPSRRVSEGLEATSSEQQHGTSARNNKSKRTILPRSIYLKTEENLNSKSKKYSFQNEKLFSKTKNIVSQIKEGVGLIIIEEQSLMIVQLKQDVELHDLRSYKKFSKISDSHFLYENNQKLSEQSKIKKGNHFIRYYSKLLGRYL
jgi:hypothetical protein